MPELAPRAGELFGIDVHPHEQDVARALASVGITARLHRASAEKLPFEAGMFDTIVAISALEFIPNLPAAVGEFVRTLAPTGTLIVVTPAHSPLADAGLRLLTGRKAEDDFAGRRQAIISTLLHQFRVDREIRWPMGALPLYTALRLRPQAVGARQNSQSA